MNNCIILTFKIQLNLPQTMWISKGFVPVPGTARHETVKQNEIIKPESFLTLSICECHFYFMHLWSGRQQQVLQVVH